MNVFTFMLFWLASPVEGLRPIDNVKVCPKTKMLNTTKFPWNDHDRSVLARAKVRCGEIYPGNQCVKLFKKWNKQDYSVICGEKE